MKITMQSSLLADMVSVCSMAISNKPMKPVYECVYLETNSEKSIPLVTVVGKDSGTAIGFAGIIEVEAGVYEDCGVALGPEYVGKGYGKQILTALVELVFGTLSAHRFICSCRSENTASRRLQLSCGFTFSHSEERIDPRTETPYVLEFYTLEKTHS